MIDSTLGFFFFAVEISCKIAVAFVCDFAVVVIY